MSEMQLAKEIKLLEKQMMDAAKNLEFEQAAQYRDELKRLKNKLFVGFVEPESEIIEKQSHRGKRRA
jgi:excinuclease ABC subunit B